MDRDRPGRAHMGASAPSLADAPGRAVEQGLDADITVTAFQKEHGAEDAWVSVGRRQLWAVLRADSRGGATHVLLGPSVGSRLKTYSVPDAPHREGYSERRLGTLARFVSHLAKNGVLREGFDPMSPADKRVVQKCAHVAQCLGIPLGYGFALLGNGAFSAELDVDMCRLGEGRGGVDPFVGNGRAAEALLGLVAGRDTEWLEVATFALHPKGRWRTAAEFAERRGVIAYDRGTVEGAFGDVARCLEGLGARA